MEHARLARHRLIGRFTSDRRVTEVGTAWLFSYPGIPAVRRRRGRRVGLTGEQAGPPP
ncbi:MAG: hypothetical protein KIT69_06340 [Propionibacteriaceae bacterium]|nr:hypothetical protein [Propionibacteriaceae bacterium]